MRGRRVGAVVGLLVFIAATALPVAVGSELADRLPADAAVFYAELDIGHALDAGSRASALIDAEAAQKLTYRVEELYGLGRELAGNYGFQPALLDRLGDCELFFVVMAKDAPEMDADGDEQSYTPSFIVLAPDEDSAADFFSELIALADRQMLDAPGMAQREGIPVDDGELVGGLGGGATLGRIGRYVIMSEGNPRELWAAMLGASGSPISGTGIYKRLTSEGQPLCLMLLNAEALLGRLKQGIEANMQAAQAGMAGGDMAAQAGFQKAMIAQMVYQGFDAVLSLDQWEHAGAGVLGSVADDEAVLETLALFSHGPSISPVLKEMLTGSGQFVVPPTLGQKGMLVMSRVNIGTVLAGTLDALSAANPMLGAQIKQGMQMMQMQLGFSLTDLLNALASDSYLMIDMEQRPVPGVDGMTAPMPDMSLLIGLDDPKAVQQALDALVLAFSASPQTADAVGKRTFQGADVYCFGMQAANEEAYPDGLTTFAAVLADRYLTLGSWDYATSVLRHFSSAEGGTDRELARVIDAHSDANLLVVVPAEFQQRMQDMAGDAEDQRRGAVEMVIGHMDGADFGLDDLDMERRLKDCLRELVYAALELQEAAEALAPETQVVSGAHKAGFYELRSRQTYRK